MHITLNTVDQFDVPKHIVLYSGMKTIYEISNSHIDEMYIYFNYYNRSQGDEYISAPMNKNKYGKRLPNTLSYSGTLYWFGSLYVANNGFTFTIDEPHNGDRGDVTGKLLPAIIYSDGGKEWYRRGRRCDENCTLDVPDI
jgi:hypothetical protein